MEIYAENFLIENGYLEMHMQDADQDALSTFCRYSIARLRTPDGWRIVNMHVSQLPSSR